MQYQAVLKQHGNSRHVQSVPRTQVQTCGEYLLLVHGCQYLWEMPGSVNGSHTIVILKLAISTMLQQETHSFILHAGIHCSSQTFAADYCLNNTRIAQGEHEAAL